MMVNQLTDFRVWETATKYVAEFWVKEDKPRALATVKLCYLIDALTGIVAFFIVVWTARLAANWILRQPGVADLVILYAVTLLFATVNGTSTAILRVFNKFSWLTLNSTSLALVKFLLVVSVVSLERGLRGIIIAYIVGEFIEGLTTTALSLRVIRATLWEAKGEAAISLLRGRSKEIGKFLLNTNLNALLKMVRNLDVMTVGYLRSPIEVGYYRVAKDSMNLLALTSDPIYFAIYPELARIWASKDKETFKAFIRGVTVFMGAVFWPLLGGVFVFAPSIIEWTVGKDFLPASNAIRIMVWMLASLPLIWAGPALLAMDRADLAFRVGLLTTIIMVVSLLLLVPFLGYIGAALAFLIYYLSWIVVVIVLFYKLKLIRRESSDCVCIKARTENL